MPANLRQLALPRWGRAAIFGKTRSGKSTLAEQIFNDYRRAQPATRCLIADTKPRFRAEWELTGLSAAHRYKNWSKRKEDYGCFIPDSVVIPIDKPAKMKAYFDLAWSLKKKVIILQSEHEEEWPLIGWGIKVFYEEYGTEPDRLLWVNEVGDLFDKSPFSKEGRPIRRIIRNGGERHIAFIGESQRPVSLPKQMISDAGRIYLLELDNEDDIKALHKYGFPRDIAIPQEPYVFYFRDTIDKRNPLAGKYYRLNLEAA